MEEENKGMVFSINARILLWLKEDPKSIGSVPASIRYVRYASKGYF